MVAHILLIEDIVQSARALNGFLNKPFDSIKIDHINREPSPLLGHAGV